MSYFIVDFESIAGYYVKIFTIQKIGSNTKPIILTIKPPHNWEDIVFKQLNRSIYYETPHYILDWRNGDIDFNKWICEVAKYIDFSRDTVFVNNISKYQFLQHVGFQRCILVNHNV